MNIIAEAGEKIDNLEEATTSIIEKIEDWVIGD